MYRWEMIEFDRLAFCWLVHVAMVVGKNVMGVLLPPQQLGYGVKRGADAAVYMYAVKFC